MLTGQMINTLCCTMGGGMILDMTHGNLCLQIAIHWYLGMAKKTNEI